MASGTTDSQENSYRSIMRGMSAFGSVQVLQIVINVVRGKFVALLLGPEGMGISQLLVSSTNTLKQVASCGLPCRLCAKWPRPVALMTPPNLPLSTWLR